jgi:hypothetical protein
MILSSGKVESGSDQITGNIKNGDSEPECVLKSGNLKNFSKCL